MKLRILNNFVFLSIEVCIGPMPDRSSIICKDYVSHLNLIIAVTYDFYMKISNNTNRNVRKWALGIKADVNGEKVI